MSGARHTWALVAARQRWLVVAALITAYVLVWAVSPFIFSRAPSDLDVFFWPSAETALNGHVLQIYPAHDLGGYPNANGPLGLVPLVPIAALANLLGWANDLRLRAGLTGVVAAVFAVLLAVEAVRIIRRGRGDVQWRLAASCVILLAPALWIGVDDYGHIEQPIELWLILLAAGAVLAKRSVAAGFVLGLAVLTRTTALLYLIPFALLSLAARHIKPATTLLPVAAFTVAVGLAPFLLADGAGVAHSLVTYRGALPIAGGSFWVVAQGTSWAGLGQHGDAYIILAVAVALSAVILWRRPAVATTPAGLFGVLTVVAACVPMLAKTVFPYYLFEPYVFAAIWWLARRGSALNWRLAAPVLLAADVFIAKWGTGLPLTGLGLVEGVISSAVLAAVIALVITNLFRARPATAPALAPSDARASPDVMYPALTSQVRKLRGS